MIAFRPFERGLSRSDFDCGNAAVTQWFREQASQQERRNNVRTHLGLSTFESEIACFYALTAHRIETVELRDSEKFGTRRYPIPAMLIAQLGVDLKYQGRGIGALTLANALRQLNSLAPTVGFEVVVVDAVDAQATSFYERHGFERLKRDGRRLFVTTKDLAQSYPNDVDS